MSLYDIQKTHSEALKELMKSFAAEVDAEIKKNPVRAIKVKVNVDFASTIQAGTKVEVQSFYAQHSLISMEVEQ